MTSFWSLWIIVLTGATFIGMTWVLLANRKDLSRTTDKTTGHNFDGIEELDNPLPGWWFWMFVITIVWGLIYLLIYPGWGNFPGLLGWTQIEQHTAQVQAAEDKFRAERDRYLALPVEEIAGDPAVRRMGMRMFNNNCAQCHGADAKGSYGFPNLTDNDWIYGGTPEAIKATLVNGRKAAMPAWGGPLGDQGVIDVTAHILSLSGRQAEQGDPAAGQAQYQTYCVACHAADGTGNPALGAPNLANGIWLYGGTESQVAHSIRAGRNGVMPAFQEALSEDKIHILTAYVYGLNQPAKQ